MPFSLKSAGTTYQHSMNTIFHKHIQKIIECYIEDIVVKSRSKSDHLADLKKVFDIMWVHQLEMNSIKSFLGEASGTFLTFVVTFREIHLDQKNFASSKRCSHQEISMNSEGCKDDCLTSEDLDQIYQDVTDRSSSWWCKESHSPGIMLASKRLRNQRIPHTFTCSCSCSIRKTLPDICQRYG